MSMKDKRDQILKASLELIAEMGFHNAPMASIANSAKVSAGTIYRYFENKDVLIIELYNKVESKIRSKILEEYKQEETPRGKFIQLFTSLVKYFIENPIDFRFVEQFHNSPYGVACRRNKIFEVKEDHNIFHDLFEYCILQRTIKDLPVVVLYALTFGPLMNLARDHILGFINLNDDTIALVIECCWDGIKR